MRVVIMSNCTHACRCFLIIYVRNLEYAFATSLVLYAFPPHFYLFGSCRPILSPLFASTLWACTNLNVSCIIACISVFMASCHLLLLAYYLMECLLIYSNNLPCNLDCHLILSAQNIRPVSCSCRILSTVS